MSVVSAVLDRYRHHAEPLLTERRVELSVVVIALLILAQLLWLAFREFSGVDVEVVAPAPDSLRVAETASPGTTDARLSLQLQSRPLFWASRRPVDDVRVDQLTAGTTGTPAKRLEEFQLTGVIGAGDQGLAIVSYKSKLLRMSVGDALDGWTLRAVAPNEAVFVSAGVRDVRRLVALPVTTTPQAQSAPAQSATSPDLAADARTVSGVSAKKAAGKAVEENASPPNKTLSLGG